MKEQMVRRNQMVRKETHTRRASGEHRRLMGLRELRNRMGRQGSRNLKERMVRRNQMDR